jgi:Ca2+/Na+ antiporter
MHGIFMVTLTLGLFFILKFRGGITKSSAGLLLLIYIIFLYFNFQQGVGIKI